MEVEDEEILIDDIDSAEQLANYISLYKSHIYVREWVNGKWGSYSLTELPAHLAVDHALSFIQRGIIPYRMVTDE